jgi:hypothetical protein
MMKSLLQSITLTSGIVLCSLAGAQSGLQSSGTQSYTGESLSRAEAKQLTQDMSSKARTELARREAHAAYKEAMSACKSMDKIERKSCVSDAKTNLRNDLAYAKNVMTETSSGGSSSGTVQSGTDQSSPMTGASSGSSGTTSGSPTRQGTAQGSSMSSEPITASERKQLTQDFSPKARYNLAKREAQAAYSEALSVCRSLSRSERSACNKEARATLQSDLAYAKSQMQQDSSGGSAGSEQTRGSSGM